MDFYIPASGPEASTPEFAVNLWHKLLIVHICSHVLTQVWIEQIESEFLFFMRLHAMLATWPNVNPPIIITGVGPHGHKIVYT